MLRLKLNMYALMLFSSNYRYIGSNIVGCSSILISVDASGAFIVTLLSYCSYKQTLVERACLSNFRGDIFLESPISHFPKRFYSQQRRFEKSSPQGSSRCTRTLFQWILCFANKCDLNILSGALRTTRLRRVSTPN